MQETKVAELHRAQGTSAESVVVGDADESRVLHGEPCWREAILGYDGDRVAIEALIESLTVADERREERACMLGKGE